MTATAPAHEPKWETHPVACEIVRKSLDDLCRVSPFLSKLSQRMMSETGTRLLDWVDRLSTRVSESELIGAGFQREVCGTQTVYRHPKRCCQPSSGTMANKLSRSKLSRS